MTIRISYIVKELYLQSALSVERVMILDTDMTAQIDCIIRKIARMNAAILTDSQIRLDCTTCS